MAKASPDHLETTTRTGHHRGLVAFGYSWPMVRSCGCAFNRRWSPAKVGDAPGLCHGQPAPPSIGVARTLGHRALCGAARTGTARLRRRGPRNNRTLHPTQFHAEAPSSRACHHGGYDRLARSVWHAAALHPCPIKTARRYPPKCDPRRGTSAAHHPTIGMPTG